MWAFNDADFLIAAGSLIWRPAMNDVIHRFEGHETLHMSHATPLIAMSCPASMWDPVSLSSGAESKEDTDKGDPS